MAFKRPAWYGNNRIRPQLTIESDGSNAAQLLPHLRNRAPHALYGIARGFSSIGTEFVLQQDPSVILLPGGGIVTGMASPEMIAARPGWKHLQAVEQGRVYTTHHAYFARHGPRSVLAVQEIARLLHPELAWD